MYFIFIPGDWGIYSTGVTDVDKIYHGRGPKPNILPYLYYILDTGDPLIRRGTKNLPSVPFQVHLHP